MWVVDFDPVALQLGPIVLRWYALAYVTGLLLAWRYCMRIADDAPHIVTRQHFDDLFVWIVLGVVLGGRLGFVLFYKPDYYLDHPLEALQMWRGGMSFHGGLLGVILAVLLFGWRRGTGFWALADVCSAAVPIGLFLGRIANFINGELWGRPTDVPWAVIFPRAGPEPRHPSALYEAALEGIGLFVLGWVLVFVFKARWRPGLISGAFLLGYALSRIIVETVREPDAFIGFLPFNTTMGQWLSVPMALFGLFMIARALARPPVAEPGPAKPA